MLTETCSEIKICTKCHTPKPVSEFHKNRAKKDGLECCCKVCRAKYDKTYWQSESGRTVQQNRRRVYTQTEASKVNQKRGNQKYRQTENGRMVIKRNGRVYYATLNGYLHRLFNAINQRCNNYNHPNFPRYGGKGVENRFASSDKFIEHCIKVLNSRDPHGLEIHRIDNGHYESGGIEFLTPIEHEAKHKQLRELLKV